MNITIRPNTRYYFQDIYGKKFRATAIGVLCREASDYKTLILKHYNHENGNRMDGMVTMPYDWIVKAETLEDILRDDRVLLPSDILLVINAFN